MKNTKRKIELFSFYDKDTISRHLEKWLPKAECHSISVHIAGSISVLNQATSTLPFPIFQKHLNLIHSHPLNR